MTKGSATEAVCSILGNSAFSQRINDGTLPDNPVKASANPAQALGRFMTAAVDSMPAPFAAVKSSGPKPG